MLKNEKRISKTKIGVLMTICFVLLCVITTGTYAWLSGRTSLLNSSFTYGDIKISISESDSESSAKDYTMLPGKEIEKDPVITVFEKSEDCWLFVKLNKSDNFGDFMTYELVDGWTNLEGYENIYYRKVSKKSSDQEFDVIKDNVVKVKDELTKQMLTALDENGDYPTFSVSAYAVQRDSKIDALSTASNAWLLVDDQD